MNLLPYRSAKVADLIPYCNNARTHSDTQILQIAASIKEFGFTNPGLIDGEHGIVAGHGRCLAAQKLGMIEVPVIELAHLTKTQRRAYILADNRSALSAGWDNDLLKIEFTDLQTEGYDLGLTFFTGDEINTVLDGEPESEGGGGAGSGAGSLAARFGVPPFSVLNAREGWWQDRKRGWIALGIRSELGRGDTSGDKLTMSETVQRLKPSADQALKNGREAIKRGGRQTQPQADLRCQQPTTVRTGRAETDAAGPQANAP